ncbi:XdhC family protein [Celeribacter naphthalenivorans]|uniref:XdhC family protein n=1 Tax=Celeribacter naphthalenivorans TaxID=1614694 RepID=UPI001CF9C254|nr:XdhC family protein [Celeribacter naphthalenivorans]
MKPFHGETPVAPFPARQSDDPEAILNFAREALSDGLNCGLVTLTEIVDGSSRRLGAQIALRSDGGYCGYVSGGCIEAAAAREALDALTEGTDRFVRFGKGSPFFDIVLPCGGGLGLTIHVLRDDVALRDACAALAQRRPTSLCYDRDTQTLTTSAATESGWHGSCFVTRYRPALRILLFGTGYEATTFATLAESAGLEVIQNDMAALSSADADTAIALLRHDVEGDVAVLQRAILSEAGYIGCLGGRSTHAKRVALLKEGGATEAQLARVHAPIGLFAQARNAHAIAVSALAEIIAHREATLDAC